jgi:catechol-2,3-dioxygenase
MIENTYDNCKKLAEFSANVMDIESLIQFYQETLFLRMINSQKEFDCEAENMGVNSQEELNEYAYFSQRLDGDE